MAYKIAEDKRVRLPAIFAGDGYILSYTAEPVELPSQDEVDDFLPPYESEWPLLPEKMGQMMEFMMKQFGFGRDPQHMWRSQHEAMLTAKDVIKEVNEEYGKRFGRSYGNGLVEEYMCDDAEAVIVGMGTIASTARTAIRNLRERGLKVGLVKLKTFKPFPSEEFQRIGKAVEAIGVIDRNVSIGTGGIVFGNIRNSIYDLEERPKTLQFHAGLSGKEVRVGDIERVAEKTLKAAKGETVAPLVEWV